MSGARVSGAIKGLLRRGSPVVVLDTAEGADTLDGIRIEAGATATVTSAPTDSIKQWCIVVGDDVVDPAGPSWSELPAGALALDLSDPTGTDHGTRWLAEKMGLTAGATAPQWFRRANSDAKTFAWCLSVVYQPFACFADPAAHTGDRLVPGISDATNPAQALALAIEHVAKGAP